MRRSRDDRFATVRRLVWAAYDVVEARAKIVDAIADESGLSREGVDLALREHVEIDAADAEIDTLVATAGDADCVHVVLSANVFVAALRAIAVARAAAPRVVVRLSKRDTIFASALVDAADDPAIEIVDDIAFEKIRSGEVHVYGRDETIASIRARAPGRVVRGHGSGFGAIFATDTISDRELSRIVGDIIVFDQRGCLSPRIVAVVGDFDLARRLGERLASALRIAAESVPRGRLTDREQRESREYIDLMRFGGELFQSESAVVGVARGDAIILPPPGRHVHLLHAPSIDALRNAFAPVSRFITCVATDAPSALSLTGTRICRFGEMQRPRLTGPVDLRASL